PVAIILHGSDGWEQMRAYRYVGMSLAEAGYVAVLIRYFDRTGTPDDVSPSARAEFLRWLGGGAAREKENPARRNFEAWTQTVTDAINYARRLPQADGGSVALVGTSLGAYVALSAAAENRLPVAA